MKLTDAKLRQLTEPGKYADGGGLFLHATAAGGRYWRLKYRYAGKEKLLAFGVYPEVSLKEARTRRDAAKKTLDMGEDPGALKQAAKVQLIHEAANTFQAVALDWLTHQAAQWTPLSAKRIRASLEADAFPAIGHRPMASITALEVMKVAKQIEQRGSGDMAGRVLQRIKAVFRYAVIHQRI